MGGVGCLGWDGMGAGKCSCLPGTAREQLRGKTEAVLFGTEKLAGLRAARRRRADPLPAKGQVQSNPSLQVWEEFCASLHLCAMVRTTRVLCECLSMSWKVLYKDLGALQGSGCSYKSFKNRRDLQCAYATSLELETKPCVFVPLWKPREQWNSAQNGLRRSRLSEGSRSRRSWGSCPAASEGFVPGICAWSSVALIF